MAGRKGLTRLLIALAFGIVMCFLIPHVILPRLGIGVALPFIYVPGEQIPGTPLTNTFLTTLITDVVVVLFAVLATRNMKEVPGRLQSVFEMMVEFIDNLTRNIIGPKSRKVFPLAATIFIFILVANYIKLLPGFDSVGILECAHVGSSGYYTNGNSLYVNSSLNAGYKTTAADFEYCEKLNGHAETAAPAGEAKPADSHTAEGAMPEDKLVALTRKVDTTPGLKLADLTAEEQTLVTAGPNGKLTVKTPLRELYFVTPFLRGPASDLTLTLAIALIAVIAIQVLGVGENGGAYWYKYINLPALGNIGNPKKPVRGFLGPIDFAVGLLEIISELAKILSFAFRLFGNIVAGQVLIFVMTFLVATGLPLIFNGLEAFVGAIQAFVFAMLFTVFSGIAMAGHGDHDEEGHEEHLPLEAIEA